MARRQPSPARPGRDLRTDARTSTTRAPGGGLAAATPARPSQTAAATPPDPAALRRLARLVSHGAPHDGVFPLRLPGVYAARRSRAAGAPTHATLGPSLCIVAQGAKMAMLGREVYQYDTSRMLVFSVDLPIAGRVIRATRAEPFLGVKLDLDPYRVAELALRVFPHGAPSPPNRRGLYLAEATAPLVDAVTRLLELLAHPEDALLLGPLVVDEILIRLLRSPIGSRVAEIGRSESGLRRIARAVAWIRAHFAQPFSVAQVARMVDMSVSSFHERFKAVTAMSPLQYQKALRLQEARQLMLFNGMDAGSACRTVGYLSTSQFSREYARLFGRAPKRDIARLREEGFATGST